MEQELKLEVDTLTVCRICLQSSEQFLSIYEKDATDTTLHLFEKIEKCAGIKIIPDPELPSRICFKCNTFLTIAHKFRTICRNSDNYLREFVCKDGKYTAINDDGDIIEEYILDYGGDGVNNTNNTNLHIQNVKTEDTTQQEATAFDYEAVEEYDDDDDDETWHDSNEQNEEYDYNEIAKENVEDDNILYDDNDEEYKPNNRRSTRGRKRKQLPKTLDITADGAAVIRLKNDVSKDRKINSSKDRLLHICDICGNTYPRKYALEAHMRRHRDERPYECEICHESFHLNFQLTRHIRKHTGVRPYTCQYCSRSFADRSTMVKHERIHRNERPYSCETCGKSFTYSNVLKVHQLTHTGEKPYNCGICGKRFARAHHLRAHLETLLHQNDPRAKTLLNKIKRAEEDVVDMNDVSQS